MSTNDLTICMDGINAIHDDMIIEPRIPVDVFVQEVENLFAWCREDIPKLTTAGVNEEKINDLNIRVGALRQAQSLWIKDHRTVKDAECEWKELLPKGYDMRDEMMHTLQYAFRGNKELLGRVNEIAKGSGDPDMIQDLNDSAVLAKENKHLIIPIGFDLTRLDVVFEMSSKCADTLAIANGSKQKGNESKVFRDKAYTYLKELVDEVRACGKYLFWKDSKRIVGYQSSYWKRRNSTKKSR